MPDLPHAGRSARPVSPSAILVLGMHRSGTSALTRALNLLGVDLGPSLLPPAHDNETGFWEHRDLVLCHDELLRSLGSFWDDPRPIPAPILLGEEARPFRERIAAILSRDFAGRPLWGLKDPRLCRLVPLYLEVMRDLGWTARFLLIARPAPEVSASLERRDGFPAAKSSLLWLEHCLAAERDTRGHVRSFVTYEQLLEERRTHLARIGEELGFDWRAGLERADAELRAFLDPSRRHHRQDERADEPLHPWLRATYLAWEAAAGGSDPGPALAAIRDRLETSGRLFFPWTDRLREENGGSAETARPRLTELPGTRIARTYETPEGRPRVSIVIPLFNKVEATARCLESISRHTAGGTYEVVLVDNASTDGTAELLASLEGNVRIVVNGKNLGFATACNQGAEMATTDLLLFLDSQAEATAGWLEPLLAVMDGDPTVAAAGSKLVSPDGTIRHAGAALPATCLMVRRRAFEAVGGFDRRYGNGTEDVDLSLRMRERRWKLVYQPASVLVHHAGDDLVSILILTRNQLEHTCKCVESIRRHTPEPHEIVFVDNGSTDGTPEWLGRLAADRPNVRVVRNTDNRGFAAGNNQALALARGSRVVLLNNDTVVAQGWLEGLGRVLDEQADVGLVGPVTNYASGPQRIPDVPYRTLAEMEAFAAERARRHAGESMPARRLVGFCLMARREVIDAIGGLDERFGTGNCEDDDWCLRAAQAGWRGRIAQGVFVHHTGGRTFAGEKVDYAASLARNFDLFKEKWGMDPAARPEEGYPFEELVAGPRRPRIPLPEPSEVQEASRVIERVWAAARDAPPAPGHVRIRAGVLPGGDPSPELRELFARFGHTDALPVWDSAAALAGELREDGLVLVLAPDAVVPGEALQELVSVAAKNPALAAVGPVSDGGLGPQRVRGDSGSGPRAIRRFAATRRRRHRGEWQGVSHLGTFCLLLRPVLAREAGGLDVRLPVAEALTDLLTRLEKAGRPVAVAKGAWVHLERSSAGEGAASRAPRKRARERPTAAR